MLYFILLPHIALLMYAINELICILLDVD